MNRKMCIDEIDVRDKRVLMRVDFNVPMKAGVITSTQRIMAAIPTIRLALKGGARSVILISHLGRPNGRKDEKYTLKPVAEVLSKKLNVDVQFLPECIGGYVEEALGKSAPGSVFLLENLRFYLEEEGKGLNDLGQKVKARADHIASFSKCLTRLGDVYVNDAFGTVHRAHASMVGIGLSVRVAGLLLKRELRYFSRALKSPQRPFLAILGGAKVSDKIHLIFNLLDKIDELIIAGGMAFTFMKNIYNMEIGASLDDIEGGVLVPRIVKKADAHKVKLHLPVDFVISHRFAEDSETGLATRQSGIPKGWMGLDIGPRSVVEFNKAIMRARTIIWNGPMGVFEWEKFSKGTMHCMDEVVRATKNGATSIIGGGDTATCCVKFNTEHLVSHVSTGGGASLELLEGKILPGIQSLNDYDPRLDEGWTMAEVIDSQGASHGHGPETKVAGTEDDPDAEYICPYREHKCPCEEVLEHPCDGACVYPFNCPCVGMQNPVNDTAKGCGATEKLCKTMRCPLCCENISCKRRVVKKCHPCDRKTDLAYRYTLYPERSIVCTTGIKPSDHPHNGDLFNCIGCETFFNRPIPTVNNTFCTGNPCYCYKIEYPGGDPNCFSCVPETGLCGAEPPYTVLM